ncbi:MAG TPA: SdpI family protein [Puia sp.]|nr:SdpI family protein [Puia sp.]
MKKNIFFTLFVFVIALVPVFYLAAVYDALPQTIPTHFGFSGKPDSFGNKNILWTTASILPFVSIGIYFLLRNIYRIDPKKTAKISPEIFEKIGMAIVLLFAILGISIIYASAHGTFSVRLLLPIMGLFFVYMGNMMHSIKPNYFVGIRLPWTLEDPANWRATHQLSGKLWFVVGIIITIGTLLLPEKMALIFFFCLTGVLVFIPIVYSYRFFKNHTQQS